MNKLPQNFEFDRYGLHTRLAQPDDSSFILSLRTDAKLARFIHETSPDLDKQIAWMQEYKQREATGSDYYFVYECNGTAIGVNRIYDIHYEKKSCTVGSWLCAPDTNFEQSVATLLIARDIMFEFLGMEKDLFDVRKENKLVLKTHRMMGAEITGETELDWLLSLSKESYEQRKTNITRLLQLNE